MGRPGIARRATVSDEFVNNLLSEILSANRSRIPATRKVERNGTVYEQNTAAEAPAPIEVRESSEPAGLVHTPYETRKTQSANRDATNRFAGQLGMKLKSDDYARHKQDGRAKR
jgi:hypothetical protein